MKNISTNKILLNSCAIAFSTSLVMSAIQPAQAAHDGRAQAFKQFREQNQGLDRHALRKMFNNERKNGNNGQFHILPINMNYTLTQGPDGISCSTSAPQDLSRRENRTASVTRNQSIQTSSSGSAIRLSSGVTLDLTSQERNITLGKNLFANGTDSIEITTNGQTKTLTAGSQVSAAEYIAAKQVLAGGSQRIEIDGSGRASGGEVDLGAITANNDVMRASDFVVASKVTTYGDFGKHSDFKLLGNLDNFGTVHALSSDSSVKGGAIRAEDINNHSGAQIKSDVDLSLEASGNLNNDGAIVSNAGLTLSGTSINNNGAIGADGNINLNSSTVNNQGLVKSFSGSINLHGADDAVLNVNNNGGTLSALNGAINLRATDYSGTHDSNLYGGDLLSRELNLNSGNGLTSVNVNQLSGVLNQSGTAAHVKAATELLTLGETCLTGDPTYYNTLGGINIAGNVFVAENLTLVAAGDITSTDNITISAADANQGYNITFIAGAAFVPTGGSDQSTVGPIPPPNANNGAVSLSGKSSKTGGGIDMGNNVTINATSTDNTGNDNGGIIFMLTFGGKEGTPAGIVDVGGTRMFVEGKNAGNNGNVVLQASAKTGTVITTGQIDANGATGQFGTVSMVVAPLMVSEKKKTVDYAANGARTSSAFLGGNIFKPNKTGDVLITDALPGLDIDSGDQIIIRGGQTVHVDGDIAADTNVQFFPSQGTLMGGTADSILTPAISAGAGSLGAPGTPLRVTSSNIVTDEECDAFIEIANTIPSATFTSLTTLGTLNINAPGTNLTVQSFGGLEASVVELRANSFTIPTNLTGKTSVTLGNVGAAPLTNANITGNIITPTLNLEGNVGTNVNNRFNLPIEIDNVSMTGGTAFVANQTSNKITINASTLSALSFQSAGSVTIDGNINVTTGNLILGTSLGTFTVEEGVNLTGRDGVSITHSGTSTKSKVAFGASSSINTSAKLLGIGNIVVSLGSTGTVVGTPENVQVSQQGGTVTFLGSGLTAKEPVNTLTAQGANITINNGFSAKNMTFGGDVNMLADPPVPAGTPIVTYSGIMSSPKQTEMPAVTPVPVVTNAAIVPAFNPNNLSNAVDTYLVNGTINNTISAITTTDQIRLVAEPETALARRRLRLLLSDTVNAALRP